MRQKFVIYPDRTNLRSEPSAKGRKVAVVFVLAVTGVVGMHALYPQDNAAAGGSHVGDRSSPAPIALAQVPPDAATDPTPNVPSTNALQTLTVDAEQATTGSVPAQSGAVSPGLSQIAQNEGRSASEPPPGKIAEASPPPKQKVARHRSSAAGGYAQYTNRDYRAWGWYAQRPSPSPFFRF